MVRCRFVGVCPWYQRSSVTCNKTSGVYYGVGRFAGCYRRLKKEKRRNCDG